MATGFYLSPGKLKKLNQILDPRNPDRNRKVSGKTQPTPGGVTPEVYLCQATPNPNLMMDQTVGVPALTRKVSPELYDHPGSALCEVCQIVPGATAGKDYDIRPCSGGAVLVYNFSGRAIPVGSLFLAIKDQCGDLIVAESDREPSWYNNAAEECPAYGVVAVDGEVGTPPYLIAQGIKPASDSFRKDYLVNCSGSVASHEEGTYQDSPIVRVLYDPAASPVPAYGHVWGPTSGQWYLTKANEKTGGMSGWVVIVSGIVDSVNHILEGRQVRTDEIFRFQLTTSLAPGGTASAWLCDWNNYFGGVGQVWSLSLGADGNPVRISVNDTLGALRADLPPGTGTGVMDAGARGYCCLSSYNDRISFEEYAGSSYEILSMQPRATMLSALVNQSSVSPTEATFDVDGCNVMQPTGGLMHDMPTEAANLLKLSLSEDDPVILVWNEVYEEWDAIAPGVSGGASLRWGIVQAGFTNGPAITAPIAVSVKSCASDGSGVVGGAFNVYIPMKTTSGVGNKSTALFTGYIVGYLEDVASTKIILTDCFDDRINTVKQWDALASDIPDGWSELTEAQGRFIVGVDGASYLLDAAGGTVDHTHAAHSDHGTSCLPEGSGATHSYVLGANAGHNNNHQTVSHIPPCYPVFNIKRVN